MIAVGIKTLKNDLSRYLQAVQAGEVIWVTDCDQVIAEIHRPTVSAPGEVSRWEAFLNEEERRGKIRRGKPLAPPLRNLRKLSPTMPKPDLQMLLDELKGDRA